MELRDFLTDDSWTRHMMWYIRSLNLANAAAHEPKSGARAKRHLSELGPYYYYTITQGEIAGNSRIACRVFFDNFIP